jgi:hypothetical protein
MEKTVAVFAKNSRENIHINLTEFHGRDLLDIRIFWCADGTNWNPSRKGISIGIEKLPILLACLHQAADILGQDAPEPSESEDDFLTTEERATLCEELNIEMEQINGILSD